MHDTETPDIPVTSPESEQADKGNVVHSLRDFSGALTLELTDDEIRKATQVIIQVRRRYSTKQATRANLIALGDEIVYRLAEECNVLAKYDPVTLVTDGVPTIEFIGKISGDPIHKYGMDHEKKQWEVQHATDKGEEFYGEEKMRSKLNG